MTFFFSLYSMVLKQIMAMVIYSRLDECLARLQEYVLGLKLSSNFYGRNGFNEAYSEDCSHYLYIDKLFPDNLFLIGLKKY